MLITQGRGQKRNGWLRNFRSWCQYQVSILLSFTTRRNLFGDFTRNTTTANLSFGDTLMNQSEKAIINASAFDFTQRLVTRTTVASQQFYNLHVNYRRMNGEPYATVGGTRYLMKKVDTREPWDSLNASSDSSTIPEYYFIYNKQIGIYPTPSASSTTISIPIEIQARDLSVADYTDGS